jgi:hypothetical protein
MLEHTFLPSERTRRTACGLSQAVPPLGCVTHQFKRWVSTVAARASFEKPAMTPIKFILRYTAVPFMATVAVVS